MSKAVLKEELPQNTAVIYARYSSDNQQETSIEGQLRECQEYAKRNGYKVINTYIDRAKSGKSADRPQFLQMIDDSKKKLFGFIIVYKFDRFSRSRFDNVTYKDALEKRGVRVLSVHEQVSDNPEGRLFRNIQEDYAQYYSEELAVKVKRGQKENALKGKFNGGIVPFGYRVNAEKSYEPNPITAPIIVEIFENYANGITQKDIVKELNARGVKTSAGNKWAITSIGHILKNRKYLGEYHYKEHITLNAFEPLITQEIFDKVQKRLEKNRKAPARFKSRDDLYLLTGKLFCGECGAQMVADGGTSRTGKAYKYYNCHNNKQKKKCKVKKKVISKAWLEDIVMGAVIEFINSDFLISQLVKRLYEMQSEESSALPILQDQLKQTEKSLNNVMKAIEQGVITSTTKSRLEELEQIKEETEIAILQEQIKKPTLTKQQIKAWFDKFKDWDFATQEVKEKLIDIFVNCIYHYENRLLVLFNRTNGEKIIYFDDLVKKGIKPHEEKGKIKGQNGSSMKRLIQP